MRFANAISVLKNPLPVFASLAAGILSALPGLFDRAGTIRSVGCGLVSESATWGDRMAALAFQLGGWGLVEAMRLAFGAAPWFVGLSVLFFAAGRLKGLSRTLKLN